MEKTELRDCLAMASRDVWELRLPSGIWMLSPSPEEPAKDLRKNMSQKRLVYLLQVFLLSEIQFTICSSWENCNEFTRV
jgi:hypothetical protein